MDLILEYVSLVTEIAAMQAETFSDKKQVKRNNKAADRLRAIASEIETEHPDIKSEFYRLLAHENATVRSWVAHHILEVMNYENTVRKSALKEISYIAESDQSINGLGNKMWLKQWLEGHPKDKKLL